MRALETLVLIEKDLKMIKHTLALALTLTAVTLPSVASAATLVQSVNTGQGANNTTDPTWTVTTATGTAAAWIPTAVNAAWIGGTSNADKDPSVNVAKWITPGQNGQANFAQNTNLTFQTIFTLPTFANFATAMVSGRHWSDNGVVSILLNGAAFYTNPGSPTTVGNATTFNGAGTVFSKTGGFKAGANTLTFVVRNGPGTATNGNPAGLLTIANVTAAVPEPGTWMLMLLGFGAIGFAMRSRTKTQVRFQFA